ncbi:pilus assembly protein [Marinobacter sp. JSM 1782161]|uniref:pilus assembly protein n=1 Tax=Marinobacter sp. JSM 1782161 TaxID=2685906 RepID=UPI0014036253|nr:PilC/PilY family type IV pilus protein [Marinobacter sp. JSM 1782161]
MKWMVEKFRVLLVGMAMVLPTAGYSAAPDLAQEPLFVGSPVAPNLLFIIDDSGSMEREYMPDSISRYSGVEYTCNEWTGRGRNRRCVDGEYSGDKAYYPFYYSAKVNKVYYSPSITYLPPFKKDGSGRMSGSSYTNASENGYYSSSNNNDLSDDEFEFGNYDFKNGFYYAFDSSNSGCGGANDVYESDCYDYVDVNNLSASDKANFANWYSYYRTRMMMSKAGIGEAFNSLPEYFRLGWGAINNGRQDVDDADNIRAVEQGVREYSSNHRTNFYDWLYGEYGNGSTPLRRALEGAGEYYEESLHAWRDKPENGNSSGNPARECRRAYTILMTDGYYNGSDPSDNVEKSDDESGKSINNPKGENYQYSPVDPFKDGRNDITLADVAMHYWKRDLRSDLENFVPTSGSDPAFWQHMSVYGVGLGVTGSVDPDSAFDAISTGDYVDWWAGSSGENKINDLLHASVNGRGGFFSADDPETFATQLAGTIGDITADAGSATAVEFDVSSFQEGALIFSAQFDPNGWSGDLQALELEGEDEPTVPDAETAIENGDGWSAKAILDNRDLTTDDRTIITYSDDSSKAVAFRWANLDTDQTDDLSYGGSATFGQQILSFIRGDRSNEDGSKIRERSSRLGSIVNSSPEYVGKPDAGWPENAPFGVDGERYAAFASANENRTPIAYVGSNDGMLHGFNATADGGNEVLAYIPNFVYSDGADDQGLHYLADPDYQHRYFVDLSTRQQDIYTKGRAADGSVTADKSWRSVLVGGGRAGAKGIYALDVTDPSAYSETDAGKFVLWEFTAEDDNRLGYVTQPPIVSMAKWGTDDVRWTAFVANGYDSTAGTTGFFMLDVEGGLDGSWDNGDYRYIEFENGGDGLSPLTVLDTTGDYLSDRIYAGDLDGNVWVATVSTDGTWASDYTVSAQDDTPQPLFTASLNQPITAEPKVVAHPDMPRAGNVPNLLIFFGTGKYLETTDVSNTDGQSVYGVWDRGESSLDRDDLASRTLTEGTQTVDGEVLTVRQSGGDDITYGNGQYGWYADMTDSGERVIVSAQTRGEFMYINSMVPDLDPCQSGGSGWLMAFGLDGRTPEAKAFVDLPESVVGYKVNGLPNQSTILGTFRFTPTSDGNVDVTKIPPLSGSVAGAGRRGWQELVE